MMQLRAPDASPFGRKVRISAAILGLDREMTVIDTDTRNPAADFVAENPLGKVPVLLDENGEAWFDSRVIVDYLDARAGGGRLIPADPKARLEALRLQALGDGICDAAVLLVYEKRWRPDAMHSADWVAHQRGKVARGVDALEAAPPPLDPLTIGTIAVACALGYLDLRHEGAWRAAHPRLVAWLAAFAARVPAFAATALKPNAP